MDDIESIQCVSVLQNRWVKFKYNLCVSETGNQKQKPILDFDLKIENRTLKIEG